jgi:hypothetical protein
LPSEPQSVSEIIFLELGQHVVGREEIRVVVRDMLQPDDLIDRPARQAADLARFSAMSTVSEQICAAYRRGE